jgi:hypothetical protein
LIPNEYVVTINGPDLDLKATIQDASIQIILRELNNVFTKRIIQHKEQRSIFDFNEKV